MDPSPCDQSYAVRLLPAAGREALLQAIIETAPDALITIDSRGLIRIFNRPQPLFQHPAEEIIGNSGGILMPSP